MFELMNEGIKIRPTFHGFCIWTIDGVSFTLTDTVQTKRPLVALRPIGAPQLFLRCRQ